MTDLPAKLPDPWREVLRTSLPEERWENLALFLDRESALGRTVYPPREDLFSALALTPPSQVKAVITGQDPYHGAGQAHGLAFSVRQGVRLPPSLRNIFREYCQDLGFPMPQSGDLTPWAREGVLLLNTVLTVREGAPGSHAGQGWEEVTDAILRAVSGQAPPAVFLLWGQYAAGKAPLIDTARHLVLSAPHPSPLSARRGFFGSRPFTGANAFLAARGRTPVNWRLP